MFMGHTGSIPEHSSSRNQLLSDCGSEFDEDESEVVSEQILYTASFEELADNFIQYDTIIWFAISLMLVIAWGFGIFMLLYLPYKRYVMRKDVSSRKLYVTPTEIVYKVSRPPYIPFCGPVTFENHVPLSLVIDIIIEQGCLQSKYGIHTIRIESIAHGKHTPVDELQVQGVSNPGTLRKIIISEASKVIQDPGKTWKATGEGETIGRFGSLNEGPGPAVMVSPAKSWKMTGSPYLGSVERRSMPSDVLLNKLDEVKESVKKLELLIEKSQPPSGSS